MDELSPQEKARQWQLLKPLFDRTWRKNLVHSLFFYPSGILDNLLKLHDQLEQAHLLEAFLIIHQMKSAKKDQALFEPPSSEGSKPVRGRQ